MIDVRKYIVKDLVAFRHCLRGHISSSFFVKTG
jgi:hypothetical protein